MQPVIGWDIGGANLKAARVEDGSVIAAVTVPCPLWQGLEKLAAAIAEAQPIVGETRRNAVTMTGELADIFSDRATGVAAIAAQAAEIGDDVAIYAGRAGWLAPAEAHRRAADIASANWHASATLIACFRRDALFADMGSTTTDLVPIAGGALAARGYSDAERLAAGELVYQGATRTPLMALARHVPFGESSTPVMNEHFATAADIHRIVGDLPEDADRHPAADGRGKSVAESIARLARMIGRDGADASEADWQALARFYADAQLAALEEGARQVLAESPLPDDAPCIAAGIGAFVLRRLAEKLGRRLEEWTDIVPLAPGLRDAASAAAPAAAVALLRARAYGSPP